MTKVRIIAGKYRGRPLKTPAGQATRPTASRAREALFSILSAREPGLIGCRFVDLFCGSGAVGLEAISRGASHALLIDSAPAAIRAAQENEAALKETTAVQVQRLDATRLPPARAAFDIAFLDPPYRQDLAVPCLAQLTAGGWLHPSSLAVAEMGADEAEPEITGLTIIDRRTYGAAKFIFYNVS